MRWETPLVRTDGSVTFGIGNPYQSAAMAIAHPSAWLYTDSDVNLDAATGKLRWYYQGVTNDFMDHDMQTSPIAATIDGVPAVIGSGKMGVVYAMNASTGKLIWKTPVGEHSKSDDYPLEAHGAQAHAGSALHDPARLTRRRAVQPGDGRQHRVRGHRRRAVHSRQAELSAGGRWTVGLPVRSRPSTSPPGEIDWDTKVPAMPLGAATRLQRPRHHHPLHGCPDRPEPHHRRDRLPAHSCPTSTNASIAIAGNAILIPAGGPSIYGPKGGSPQLVAYTVR